MNKVKYYYVWIEGLSPRNGELVSKLTDRGYEITTKITEAMRVKPSDVEDVIHYLRRHGVADWVLDSPDTFVPTTYAPSGKVLDLNRISLI